MGFDRIIQMFARMFMRKAMMKGMDEGINYLANKRSKPQAASDQEGPWDSSPKPQRRNGQGQQMTPEEREQRRKTRQMQKTARQATRMARRMGRF